MDQSAALIWFDSQLKAGVTSLDLPITATFLVSRKTTFKYSYFKKKRQIMFYKRDLLIFPNGTLLIKFR